ncbi:MAG: hypothetical protein KatS3mg113_0442 [Planctomycetaceae bacterium]|nr:MAG: hypothetical protein KatS3mg113_0442 [Planctomycetaceae bacterium]
MAYTNHHLDYGDYGDDDAQSFNLIRVFPQRGCLRISGNAL